MPFLLAKKVISLDYVLVSHFDYDHYGGLVYLIDNYCIKNIIISKQYCLNEEFVFFVENAKEKGINIVVVEAGDIVFINKNVYIYILYPDNKYIPDSANNNSIVCKFVYYDFTALFTGDIESGVEDYLIKKYGNVLKSNALKIAHHGSNTSSNKRFINTVNPDISVICVGKRNRYGHPSLETINTLISQTTLLLRTDINGQISIHRFLSIYNNVKIMYKK